MTPVVFSERSRTELREIGDYIAQDNPFRSVTFVNELIDKAEAVGHAPNAYPKRDDIQPGLRMAQYGSYLILFRVEPVSIEIVHIVHGARDLRKMFEK